MMYEIVLYGICYLVLTCNVNSQNAFECVPENYITILQMDCIAQRRILLCYYIQYIHSSIAGRLQRIMATNGFNYTDISAISRLASASMLYRNFQLIECINYIMRSITVGVCVCLYHDMELEFVHSIDMYFVQCTTISMYFYINANIMWNLLCLYIILLIQYIVDVNVKSCSR